MSFKLEEIAEQLMGPLHFDIDVLRAKYEVERDKRWNPDANDQYIEVTAEFSKHVEDPFAEEQAAREPVFDDVEVAIIGAGFGGLLMGKHLREAGLERIRLIEQASDVGGTWYWNRYPGVQCDVESYIYLPLLEELGYMPRHRYAYGSEIFEYCKKIARHYDLYQDALFQTEVVDVRWDEAASRWCIQTDQGDRTTARFIVMATGPINRPKLPGIPGINEFEGYTFHTARWDYRYTGGDASGNLTGLRDKRVGVIGTGATAIQCVPYLGPWAERLYVFQRTPSAVDARDNFETDADWFASLEPGWQRRRMENFDTLMAGGEQEVDLVGDRLTGMYRKLIGEALQPVIRKLGRPLTAEEREGLLELADYQTMEAVRSRVESIVENPETAERLKPWYRLFCKRPCFNDEYLETFNRPNVTLVDTDGRGVERLTRNAVVANGIEHEVDCLIFATGFELNNRYAKRAGYDAVGRDGLKLSEKLKA